MGRKSILILCVIAVFASVAAGQSQDAPLEPLHVAAGTILTFHLQTRLHPNSADQMDSLPPGTILKVKLLEPLDSSVDRDGTEFHGVIVSSVTSGDEIVVHPDAEVRGVLALLRSKNHPDGFRYELLVTRIKDQTKSYDLTASLNASFFDGSSPSPSATKAGVK